MKYLIVCMLILLSGCIYAQSHQWFDFKGEPCTSSAASFFSEYIPDEKGLIHTRFFLATKTIAFSEQITDSVSFIKNGAFKSFYANGKWQSTGRYQQGAKDSLWLTYHPNGMLADSTWYKNDIPVGTALSWYDNGFMSDSIHYEANKNFKVSWYDNGEVLSHGSFGLCDSIKTGDWVFYHKNGTVSSKQQFNALGKLIAAKYFDEKGNAIPEQSWLSEQQQDELFTKDFMKYLRKELYFPSNLSLKNSEAVTVVVAFYIGEEQHLKEVTVLVPFHEAFDQVAVNVIKKYKKWPVFMDKNRKTARRFSIPIIFKME